MLDYTKAAFGKIVDDFKKFIFIFSIGTQAVSTLYLIYALCVQQGILAVNIIMLILSSAYLIFLCVQGLKSNNKTQKKIAKRIYKWGKILTQLYTLIIALYALQITVDSALSLSVILTALQLIGWVLQVLFEIVSILLEKLYDLVATAIQADIEQIKKPVSTVGNFFKKITGQEVKQPEPPTKTREFLDALVAKKKEEKRKSKQLLPKDEGEIKQPEPQTELAASELEENSISSTQSENTPKRKFPFFKRK